MVVDTDRHNLTVFYLKSFDMDSVQVGKAVFVKEIYTTLGVEPRTYSYPGRSGNPCSVCWVKKIRIQHFLKGEFDDSENHSLSRA